MIIEKNTSIQINKDKKEVKFSVGDLCQVGSYNLIYTGEIISITEKTVKVSDCGHTKNLSIYKFVNMNWDYDFDYITKHNIEEMHCI